jgi:DNA-binding CsgD family transcriptional regulator
MPKQSLQSARITLRQLCSLDVPTPVLLPSLLEAVRGVVPAAHAAFFYCDEFGNMQNIYAEKLLPPIVMALYYEKHFAAGAGNFKEAYLSRVAAKSPISKHTLTAEELASDYYKDVMSRLDVHHILYAIIKTASGAIGQLSLYRSQREASFSAEDEKNLEDVLRYLNMVFASPYVSGLPSDNAQAAEESIAILDLEGNILFADPNWDRMIRLARGDAISPKRAAAELTSTPKFIASILQAIRNSPLAVHSTQTMWGRFRFRSHQLTDRSGSNPVAALLLSRIAPESVRIAEGAAALGLSPQQREVALLISSGFKNSEIAEHLGVTINTANYHVKTVFTKLAVTERGDVAKVLRNSIGK